MKIKNLEESNIAKAAVICTDIVLLMLSYWVAFAYGHGLLQACHFPYHLKVEMLICALTIFPTFYFAPPVFLKRMVHGNDILGRTAFTVCLQTLFMVAALGLIRTLEVQTKEIFIGASLFFCLLYAERSLIHQYLKNSRLKGMNLRYVVLVGHPWNLADVYRTRDDGTQVILGTIGVDVSSDWTRFPRYGFVATFDDSKLQPGVIDEEMQFLSRCHINGVQFQDWHNKHHWPLGGTREAPAETYTDIANRSVSAEVIRRYIDTQHALGMKSMFYNLCFGALDDAADDGVKEDWYIFKGAGRTDKDVHDLPDSWKSDIFLLDPSNPEWQDYIGQRNDDVYATFDFDGYQIDQLGDRGTRYDYQSNTVNLPRGYASFIEAMKTRHPAKRQVMNAVSGYGASQIASTGQVDFLYNEMWGGEGDFEDLRTAVMANDQYSNHTLQTVFAAYMNYNVADREGLFNTPGVLLADAVMFALGASHLELGDHMLCKEYFPNSNLQMDDALRTAIVRYYDFLTAYQNLLRGADTGAETDVSLTASTASSAFSVNAWPPRLGGLTTYAKTVDGKTVIHLLNFRDADSLSWRDADGTMPEPRQLNLLGISLDCNRAVSKVWVASPDRHAGAPEELAFTQADGRVDFTLPALKYWTMIVLE